MRLLAVLFQTIIALSGLGLWIVGVVVAFGRKDRFAKGLLLLYVCVSFRIAISIAYIAIYQLSELYLVLVRHESLGFWVVDILTLVGKITDCMALLLVALIMKRRLGFREARILVWVSTAWVVVSLVAYLAYAPSIVPHFAETGLNVAYALILFSDAVVFLIKAPKKGPVERELRLLAWVSSAVFFPWKLAVILIDGFHGDGLSPLVFVYFNLLFYLAFNVRMYIIMASLLLGRSRAASTGSEESGPSFDDFCRRFVFSTRERDIAGLLLEYMSYKHIAERLFISLDTVKSHAKSIYRKTNCKNRLDLIALYRVSP